MNRRVALIYPPARPTTRSLTRKGVKPVPVAPVTVKLFEDDPDDEMECDLIPESVDESLPQITEKESVPQKWAPSMPTILEEESLSEDIDPGQENDRSREDQETLDKLLMPPPPAPGSPPSSPVPVHVDIIEPAEIANPASINKSEDVKRHDADCPYADWAYHQSLLSTLPEIRAELLYHFMSNSKSHRTREQILARAQQKCDEALADDAPIVKYLKAQKEMFDGFKIAELQRCVCKSAVEHQSEPIGQSISPETDEQVNPRMDEQTDPRMDEQTDPRMDEQTDPRMDEQTDPITENGTETENCQAGISELWHDIDSFLLQDIYPSKPVSPSLEQMLKNNNNGTIIFTRESDGKIVNNNS